MQNSRNFYINGQWVAPKEGRDFDVIDPSNEEVYATISMGGQADTDAAVAAAKAAFPTWRHTSKAERLELMESILDVYMRRSDEMGAAISQEMGAPIDMAKVQQSGTGSSHLNAFITAFNNLVSVMRNHDMDLVARDEDVLYAFNKALPSAWNLQKEVSSANSHGGLK